MAKRAQNQVRKRIEAAGEPSQIEQLCLDSIEIKTFTPNIKKMLQSCTSLEYLTMNDCGFKSLENFPVIRTLLVLEMSDNNLTGDDLNKLAVVPQIIFLTLDSNKLTHAWNLRPLLQVPGLEILQIHHNAITQEPNYRRDIFRMLPEVKVIDCQDRSGNLVKDDDHSEYFSYREPRSRIDLTDLLDDDDEPNPTIKNFPQTAADYLDEPRDSKETSHSNEPVRGSFYASKNVRRYHSDLMNIRTGGQDDSEEEEEEKDLLKDFRKKFHKKD